MVLTLALALIYSAGNLGVYLLYRRLGSEFRVFPHAVFPLVSTVAVLWVAYKSLIPLPDPPVAYAPVILVVWLVAGVFVLIVSKSLGREWWLVVSEVVGPEAEEKTVDQREGVTSIFPPLPGS